MEVAGVEVAAEHIAEGIEQLFHRHVDLTLPLGPERGDVVPRRARGDPLEEGEGTLAEAVEPHSTSLTLNRPPRKHGVFSGPGSDSVLSSSSDNPDVLRPQIVLPCSH